VSRPLLTWDDLKGKRVAVWGLGREGQASQRKLRELGVEPLLVEDDPKDADTKPTSSGALATCDVVVKSPGISRYREEVARLEAEGIPVVGGLGLWLAGQDLDRVVCVTGTKGKSTTTSIIGHLLNGLGYPTQTGGNIGTIPWDTPENSDYWVIEVSSYQATDLPCTPPVVAVTSLHPDHLDWHGGVEQYYRDKLSACTQPGAELTVANGDSELLEQRRDLLGPRVEWVHADDDPVAQWMAPLNLRGQHNRRNALIARRCIQALGIEHDETQLEKAAEGYQPLPSRLTTIGTIDGVAFIDDSLSTNVLPTIAALDAFPAERIALIVGGHDRGIDYAPLAAAINAREAPTKVLTLPDSGPRIHVAIGRPDVVDCPDLATAVREGFRWARPDGVVLLSPAAPSFGQFRDYRDRGEAFARAMHSLRP
jgi:UDP-N-acetylmuramoyl-L-alanine---L-glutamate ligase